MKCENTLQEWLNYFSENLQTTEKQTKNYKYLQKWYKNSKSWLNKDENIHKCKVGAKIDNFCTKKRPVNWIIKEQRETETNA